MPRQKREPVSVSFHYLAKETKDRKGAIACHPFSRQDFAALSGRILNLPPLDLSDERIKDQMRFKAMVPLERPEQINDRTLFGAYRASYWGHAYENTARGMIPADSLSLRPFFYMLYLSESGRIYIGTQYLGQFGGYTGLKNTLIRLLPEHENVTAHSFRIDSVAYKDVHPKEVRVSVARKGDTIATGNAFSESAIIAFKKQGRRDIGFEEDVKKHLLPHFGKSRNEVRKAVAAILSANELIDVSDDEIADCTIIADVNGRTRNIYMIEQGSFASQFHIDVPFNADGHPLREATKKAMLSLLKENIIARGEDV
jgi:hypothetical protein